MRTESFFDIMNDVDETLLERAETAVATAKRKRLWKRVSALAAVFAIAIFGVNILRIVFYSPAGAGSGGRDDLTYMAYVGPVLPLTVLNDDTELTATRAIDYDFSPYDVGWGGQSRVTDSYVLTNSAGEDQTLTLAYPFSEHLNANAQHLPQITVDGKTIDITYYPGPYTGDYMGVWGGGKEDEGSVNLDGLSSFQEFQALLTDGNYQAMAFDEFPTLDQPVVVYEISDPIILTEESKRGENPSLAMEFTMNYDKTSVLTYNTNGARWNRKTGYASHSFSIPKEHWPDFGMSRYILIMGEDIDGYTLQGYQDGGCDKGEEIDITATVTRYETTIGAFLWERITERSTYVGDEGDQSIADAAISDELFYGLCAELLTSDGILSPDGGVERYESGRLGDILSAVRTNPRIIYLTFEVTVPAGGSVVVDCSMLRDAHVNYVGDTIDRDGYDMATTLGSTLDFTEQTASVSNTSAIEIVAQNFGFDLDAGITQVVLDIAQPHYWMEVRRLPTDTSK